MYEELIRRMFRTLQAIGVDLKHAAPIVREVFGDNLDRLALLERRERCLEAWRVWLADEWTEEEKAAGRTVPAPVSLLAAIARCAGPDGEEVE